MLNAITTLEEHNVWRTQCLWLSTSTSLTLQQPTSAGNGNLGQVFNRWLKIISTVSAPQRSSARTSMSASLVTIQNDCLEFSIKKILCFLEVSFILFLRSFKEWRWEMPDSGGIRMTTYLYKRHYPLPPPPGVSNTAINWLFINSPISDLISS